MKLVRPIVVDELPHNCEWCDLAKNRCLLYEKQCYDKGKPLNRDCQFFKHGEWGDNAEIPDSQYYIEFREFLLSSENGRNDLMQSVCKKALKYL